MTSLAQNFYHLWPVVETNHVFIDLKEHALARVVHIVRIFVLMDPWWHFLAPDRQPLAPDAMRCELLSMQVLECFAIAHLTKCTFLAAAVTVASASAAEGTWTRSDIFHLRTEPLLLLCLTQVVPVRGWDILGRLACGITKTKPLHGKVGWVHMGGITLHPPVGVVRSGSFFTH